MTEIIGGLEWEIIDPYDYPQEVVMAGNFDKDSLYYGEKLVGYLYDHLFGDHLGVLDDLAPLELRIEIPRVTHYIKFLDHEEIIE